MDRNKIERSLETSGVPDQLFLERERRLQAAFQLKQPDRIPIIMHLGYLLAEMGGITKQELLENQEKAQDYPGQGAPFLREPKKKTVRLLPGRGDLRHEMPVSLPQTRPGRQ